MISTDKILKISDVIARLQELKEAHGDLIVKTSVVNKEYSYARDMEFIPSLQAIKEVYKTDGTYSCVCIDHDWKDEPTPFIAFPVKPTFEVIK